MMQDARGFYAANASGKRGEQFLKTIFWQYGHVFNDVSNHPDYMRLDIDFTLKNGRTGEVKTDSVAERTGNMFYETELRYEDGATGVAWTDKCQADFLFYLVEHKNPGTPILDFSSVYFGKWNKIKSYVDRRVATEGKPWKQASHNDYQTVDRKYRVTGWCIPIAELVRVKLMRNLGTDERLLRKFIRR